MLATADPVRAAVVPAPAPAPVASPAPTAAARSVYGLQAPTLETAHAAFVDVVGSDDESVRLWQELVAQARPGSGDLAGLGRLADAMRGCADGVVALCGSALAIRVRSFEELSHVRTICAEAR